MHAGIYLEQNKVHVDYLGHVNKPQNITIATAATARCVLPGSFGSLTLTLPLGGCIP